jgi:hypothetical protein
MKWLAAGESQGFERQRLRGVYTPGIIRRFAVAPRGGKVGFFVIIQGEHGWQKNPRCWAVKGAVSGMEGI